MIEIFTAIALLCQVSPSMTASQYGGISKDEKDVDKYQLKCQKSYVKCVLSQKAGTQEEKLAACILAREI